MRTNPVPPRLPPGAQPKSAAKPLRTLQFKTEDFEQLINRLPKEKQNYALGLFPKDPTGRTMKIDEHSFKAFMTILDRKEQKSFGWIHSKLKDSGRFIPEPAPEARRPAKGEDIRAPIGSQEKPDPESAKPQRSRFSEPAPVRLFPMDGFYKPGGDHPGRTH
jgi:hypothetical protein